MLIFCLNGIHMEYTASRTGISIKHSDNSSYVYNCVTILTRLLHTENKQSFYEQTL